MQFPSVRVDTQELVLNGGLDTTTPPLRRLPGRCLAAQNFEQAVSGGYRRVAGYERYSGKAKPSDATYTLITAAITGTIAVGDTVTGGTSGATATVISRPSGQVIVTAVTGTFQDAETLLVSAASQGTVSGTPAVGGASTSLLHATYNNLAADVYRALIAAVPGSGSILGVIQYSDVVYAFRNNAGGTAAALYKSSGSGWTSVALGRELSFTSGGTYVLAEGDTITGATSAATAVVTRVVLESGSFAAGTAAGRVVFASQTGTFQAENLNVGANLNVATIAGDSSAITLLPDGRYEFDIINFGGSANTQRVYGCDGVNRGFEFDGTVFVPIRTGMTTDTPDHVQGHMNQLFFAFEGSVQHSGPGTPYIWSAVLGASELAMGDRVTGFAPQSGGQTAGALAIFTRNRTSILYGTGSSDWLLVPYREELGAFDYTVQNVGRTVFLDDRGITDFRTTQDFGNFADSTISDQVRDRINELRVTAVAACISRDLNQYRIFFSGGVAYYLTFSRGKLLGIMPQLLAHDLTCVWSGEQTNGSEAIFFGDDSGYVYQMEKGTSFDGEPIEYYFTLAYNHAGTPRTVKHYRHAMLEIEGSSYVAFNFGYTLGHNTSLIEQPGLQSTTTSFSPAYWDSFTWDAFTWDGLTLMPSEIDMAGDAENCSLGVYGSSDIYEPFTVTGAVIHFTPRRAMR